MKKDKQFKYLVIYILVFFSVYITFAETTNLVPFRNGDKFGFYSISEKKVVIPCEYQSVLAFAKDLNVTWVQRNNLYYLVNTKGQKVSAKAYSHIGIPTMDLLPVSKNKKWGVIDSKGKTIVPCEFDDMGFFVFNMCRVKKKDKWGAIDRNGKLIIPTEYKHIYILSEKRIAGEYNGKHYLLNKKGEKLFELTGMPETPFTDGLSPVSFPTKEGARVIYINKSGKTIIPPEYCLGLQFSDGLAAVAKRVGNTSTLLWGYINTKGEEVIQCKFQQARYFNKNTELAPIKQDDHWGFIDRKGDINILTNYDQVGSFKENLAPVKKNGLWGYINPKGEVVIPIKYKEVDLFRNGIAWVRNKDNDLFYIDRNGKEFWTPAPPFLIFTWMNFIIALSALILLYFTYRLLRPNPQNV